MTALNWEQARKRDRQRIEQLRASSKKAKARRKRGASRRQQALAEFADKHELGCFKCGSHANEWAKTGKNSKGPWAICVPCITHRQAAGLTQPAAR